MITKINSAVAGIQPVTKSCTTCDGGVGQSLSGHRLPLYKTHDVKQRHGHGMPEAESRSDVMEREVGGSGGALSECGWIDGSLVRVVGVMSVRG